MAKSKSIRKQTSVSQHTDAQSDPQLDRKLERKLTTHGYNPFLLMDDSLSFVEKKIELCKDSLQVALLVIEDLLSKTHEVHRENTLLEFKESFGINHSLECSQLTVILKSPLADLNVFPENLEAEEQEPVSNGGNRDRHEQQWIG
jgi:hypothetical protein